MPAAYWSSPPPPPRATTRSCLPPIGLHHLPFPQLLAPTLTTRTPGATTRSRLPLIGLATLLRQTYWPWPSDEGSACCPLRSERWWLLRVRANGTRAIVPSRFGSCLPMMPEHRFAHAGESSHSIGWTAVQSYFSVNSKFQAFTTSTRGFMYSSTKRRWSGCSAYAAIASTSSK